MSRLDLTAYFKSEHQRLVRYVRSRLQETAEMDAEDIVQDVLTRILAKTDITVPFEELAAYIYQSLKNRIIDLFRTHKPTVPIQGHGKDPGLLDVLHDVRPDALQALQHQESRKQLFAALASLNENERRIVIAQELEGHSFRVLAEAWGVPQNTLLSHKARAMEKLKQYFVAHKL
jgi:RNA polymerase sigma factor (sigma-70 family)